ncbi:serine hydrolase domain-containing protein [Tenacibaculum aquimarinum]|uniref:serine hydrolase domain-containing protein n=1 Tax=Tenacibaculum aquimarinum TaxID=2910675 RepID=UPI001F0AC30B|nr:serine hydrolase domain-containing protein [Tenacibaculum aquimarinum]MCH3882688.1 beta-lactamase family protein [Tenacibaculum aquimarinum]
MKKNNILFLLFFIVYNVTLFSQNSEEKNSKANSIAQEFLNSQKIPGMSISVSQKGKIIWSKGFGYSDIINKTKVNPNSTQFRIASISKTLTSVALAKLVDDKKLNLDAILYEYVPKFPKKEYDFTIRQLGGHLAGIRHYNANEFLLNKKMSIVEGLDVFKDSKLLFKPQTKFKYSTYGWNLLSVAIQNASKKDYFQYMEKNIFIPLKMNNTVLDISDKENSNRTQFYIKRKGEIKLGPPVNNEFKAAGGGFLSTSEDLVLFGNEFIKQRIISKSSLKELVTPQKTTNGKNTKYGIGISISKTKKRTVRYSHSGGGVGASTYLLIYPEEEIVIAILTNLSRVGTKILISELEDIFIQ